MAWEISITPEGWQGLYTTLQHKSKTWLFKAVNAARYGAGEKRLPQRLFKQLAQEGLANEAYDWIHKTNTCDNGAHHYYIDKEGWYTVQIAEEIEEY